MKEEKVGLLIVELITSLNRNGFEVEFSGGKTTDPKGQWLAITKYTNGYTFYERFFLKDGPTLQIEKEVIQALRMVHSQVLEGVSL